jgi:hypothetical protein
MRGSSPGDGSCRDQILFLNHNLNARAISSLQQNADQTESIVRKLVREMEAAIAEAESFIARMLASKQAVFVCLIE